MPTNIRKPGHARLKRSMTLLGTLMIAALTVTLLPATAAPASAATSVRRTAAHSSIAARRAQREITALRVARRHIGAPYQYGASGPGSFDCSGLTHYSLIKAGFVRTPRTAAAQASFVHRIPRRALRPGDLIFFFNGGNIYHVAFFVRWDHGVAIILHAPYSGQRVRIERIWTNNWFAGTLR